MITFDFSGDFTGAFREIPLREGETISEVGVSDGETSYKPGASAEVPSEGAPGTFGTKETDKGLRIVWHYQASNETRSFRIHYRLRGVATAYDDVVDVNLKIWGDEWETGLGRLTGTLHAPGEIERAWGHPVSVRGDVTLDGRRATLRALDIPAGQFVELRALVPRRFFTSTDGMKVEEGLGLEKIVAEERADAAAYEHDQKKIDDALHNLRRTVTILLALALLPALVLMMFVWGRYGRERATGYDREYEQEPPTDTEPALVPGLLAQGGTAGSLEFTATLFDLIRRGRYKADPVTTERKIWGGLETQQVADLELSLGDVEKPIEGFEAPVASVVDGLVVTGPERLSRFRDRIEDNRVGNSKRFTEFKEAVGTAISGRRWFRNDGLVGCSAARCARRDRRDPAFAGVSSFNAVAPTWKSVVVIALGACGLVNAAVLGHGGVQPPPLAAPDSRGSGRGGALGGVPPLSDRLPAPRHRTRRDARAVGALPRLWDRLRHRGARPPGCAAAHAGGARPGQQSLLDRAARRPRVGADVARDRRPGVWLRLRACASVLRLGRLRRRLLGRGRRRRRRRWRRRLVSALRAVLLALAVGSAGALPGCGGRGSRSRRRPTRRHAVRPRPAHVPARERPGGADARHAGRTACRGRSSSSSTAPGGRPRAGWRRSTAAGSTPGLVLIAPASKGQTWSMLRSEQDLDLESVNFALGEAYERCKHRPAADRPGRVLGRRDLRAVSLGVSNGDLFPAIMALSPGGILGGNQVGVPRFFVSHGTLDTVLPIERAGDAVVKKLRDAGYPVTYRRFRGGHEASEDVGRSGPLVPAGAG